MKKVLSVIIVIFFLCTNIVFCDEIEDGLSGVLLAEYESGEIVYSNNIENPMEIASITKLMTYLVTINAVEEGRVSLEDVVTIGINPPKEKGSSFKLKAGEEIKLKILIESILIASANDSCVAIAEHIADSEDKFVELMNKKAEELGLKKTRYVNSNGLSEKAGQNTMSIKDIFNLSRYVIKKYPETLNITKRQYIEIPSRKYKKENTNPLLFVYPYVDGLKTGYTEGAGYCLVSTMIVPQKDVDDIPFRLIGITMGAKSKAIRKDKSMKLLKYGIDNFNKKKKLAKGQYVDKIKVFNGKKLEVNVFAAEDLIIFFKNGDEITEEIILDDIYTAPMTNGHKVGKYIIYKNNKKAGEVNLIIKSNVKKANAFERLWRYITGY